MALDSVLRGPCAACPFRTDEGAVRLRRGRKEEIAHALRQGNTFHCHKTVHYTDFEEGEYDTNQVKACGGSMVVMLKDGTPNGPLQVGLRLGALREDEFSMDAPVYDSLEQFIEERSI